MAAPFWIPPAAPELTAGELSQSGYWEAPRAYWSEWDTASIGGLRLPGLVAVSTSKACRLVQKKTPGSHGASPSILAMEPGEIRFRMTMWHPQHLIEYEDVVNLILNTIGKSMAGKKQRPNARQLSTAFDVKHPSLAIHRIFAAYFVDFQLPERSGTTGTMQAGIRMQEFLPLSNNTAPRAIKAAMPDNNFAGIPIATPPSSLAPQNPATNPEASAP